MFCGFRCLLAGVVMVVALAGVTSVPRADDDDGNRVCLGSMGQVACVPPSS